MSVCILKFKELAEFDQVNYYYGPRQVPKLKKATAWSHSLSYNNPLSQPIFFYLPNLVWQ